MMYTLSWLAIANVQNNLFLWCKYVLNREEPLHLHHHADSADGGRVALAVVVCFDAHWQAQRVRRLSCVALTGLLGWRVLF
jgi:hypothetical protein